MHITLILRSLGKHVQAGFDKARVYSELPHETLLDMIELLDVEKKDSVYNIPEKVFTNSAYRRGFQEGLYSLLEV